MLKIVLYLLCCAYLLSPTTSQAATPRHHIRVILDLSKSMRNGPPNGEGNDPGGMAILSTLLLYDLARPDIGMRDSFKVIPFHEHWQWHYPQQATPHSEKDHVISAEPGIDSRKNFFKELKNLEYNAKCTHFYPGIKAASLDLQNTGKSGDTRTIVLITDGLPDNPCEGTVATQDIEQDLIESQLVPEMIKNKDNPIKLYVLAFGPNVKAEFFKKMTHTTGGNVFTSGNGETLLKGLMDLFAESVDYEVVGPSNLPLPQNNLELTLSQGMSEPTAVVVFNIKDALPPQIPHVNLDKPINQNSAINFDGQYNEIAPSIKNLGNSGRNGIPGGAYHIDWILNPSAGFYKLDVLPASGQVAVVRPLSARFEIIGTGSQTKPTDVIAKMPLPLGIQANNLQGGGLSATLTIQYKLSAPAIGLTPDHPQAPIPPSASNKLFTLPTQFEENPLNPAETYPGYIEAWAYKDGRELAKLDPAYSVTVHPYLAIKPVPTLHNAGTALEQGQEYCTEPFKFEITGHLPKLNNRSQKYILSAYLDYQQAGHIANEFLGAEFKLDGSSIQFNAPASPYSPAYSAGSTIKPGEWFKGRPLSQDDLLKAHTFCVKIGKPKSANTAQVFELPLRFTLQHPPYDNPDTIKPLLLKLSLAEIEPISAPSIEQVFAALSGLLALAWFLRGRADLPTDLGVALAVGDHAAVLTFQHLPSQSIFRRCLGLAEEKPIIPVNGEPPLAWLCANDKDLYRLRLAKNVSISEFLGQPLISNSRYIQVSVHTDYLFIRQRQQYRMRLEYQK